MPWPRMTAVMHWPRFTVEENGVVVYDHRETLGGGCERMVKGQVRADGKLSPDSIWSRFVPLHNLTRPVPFDCDARTSVVHALSSTRAH